MMKTGARTEAILGARKRLGLPSSTTLREIRRAYRRLARECHPDARADSDREESEASMRELNAAYELLIDYCERYSFTFSRETVDRQCRKQDPSDYWHKQFVD